MPADEMAAAERLARIERLIEVYRDRKRRQILQRTRKLLRRAEARRQLVELERSPALVH